MQGYPDKLFKISKGCPGFAVGEDFREGGGAL